MRYVVKSNKSHIIPPFICKRYDKCNNQNNNKQKSGFTLLEATAAIALWLLLSASVLFVLHHVSGTSRHIITRQSAFENARISMDALIMNIQTAQAIHLETGAHLIPGGDTHVLQTLRIDSLNPDGGPHPYLFSFDINAAENMPQHQRLNFGGNELAEGIASIQIIPASNNRRMDIIIRTGCENPIILRGSVDIRYKMLTTSP